MAFSSKALFETRANPTNPVCVSICRTVFILSEALDEQLKALWFSPFQTDDIEVDLDMVSVLVYIQCMCKNLMRS